MADRATRQRAILCVMAASGLYTVAAALVKSMAAEFATVEIMFFRSLVVAAVMLPLQLRATGWTALRPRRPMGHVWRLAFGFTGMLTAYYGYGALPLATNTALGFCMPLFLTILSVPLYLLWKLRQIPATLRASSSRAAWVRTARSQAEAARA